MSRYAIGDRIRVKFGVDRGHYGTIRSINGDDKSYYGVMLDCHDREMGYSEYELALALPRPTRPLWQYEGVADSRGVYVPKELCVCPECNGELVARAMAWDTETGRPKASSIEIDCMNELRDGGVVHSWFQSDWQSIRDKIAVWCDAE